MQVGASSVWFQVVDAGSSHEDRPLTFDQPVGELPIVDDGRWSATFTSSSLTSLLVWIVLLVLLQAIAWPYVRRIFTRFPDRGWSFARLTTLLLAAYPVWLLASLEVISFRAVWAGASMLVVGLVALVLTLRTRREDDEPFWRNPAIVAAEIIFWAVLALFLLFRAINPDSYHYYWGGEKPMEFAHLNAILRSAHFPPVDPWYSGGYINYYYYGTYIVAFLIKLTGIPTEYSFNLAQPTLVAILAMAAFGISSALGRKLTGSTAGAILTGGLGVFLISFAGNLVDVARVIDRWLHGEPNVDAFSYWVFQPTRAIPRPEANINITEFPYFAALYADLHPHVIAMPITILVIALGWQLASTWRPVTLALSRPRSHRSEAVRLGATLILLALALGTIFMTNAWDLPMYIAVSIVAVVMATKGMQSIWRRLAIVAIVTTVIGALAYALILPFTKHYVALFGEIDAVRDRTPLQSIESHFGGQLILLTVGIAALAIHGSRRPWSLAQPGLPLLALAGVLLLRLYGDNQGSETIMRIADAGTVVVAVGIWLIAAWVGFTRHGDFMTSPTLLRIELVHIGVAVIVLLALDRIALALYAGIGLVAALLWLGLQRPSARYVSALVAGGMLLGGALELLFLVDDLSGTQWYRMNTIFKFYNQIWVLLGISAAVLAGRAIWIAFSSIERPSWENASAFAWPMATASIAGTVIIASLVYPVVATPVRLDQRFPSHPDGLSLNAYAWMEEGEIQYFQAETENGRTRYIKGAKVGYADDLAAIDWLNEHVSGTPVIAEASFGTYRCNGSRFSIATGLPAVIGWERHQQQQRYLDALATRVQALRTLYTEPDAKRQQQIIEQYDIEYVIVGDTERHYAEIQGNDCIDTGNPEAIASLESLEGDVLEVAFKHGTTTVYRVVGDASR